MQQAIEKNFLKNLWNSLSCIILYANALAMADMMMPQKDGKRKKHSLRVDLTPMVDLGFLLITFFMLTTMIAKPTTMAVTMPDNTPTPNPTAYPEESTVTLLPAASHQCYYYYGAFKDKAHVYKTTLDKARTLLLAKEKEVSTLPATLSTQAHQLHVIIKPADNAKYEDAVHLLDEMNILNIKYYTLSEPSSEEVLAMN